MSSLPVDSMDAARGMDAAYVRSPPGLPLYAAAVAERGSWAPHTAEEDMGTVGSILDAIEHEGRCRD
jgi:hypothetical protein